MIAGHVHALKKDERAPATQMTLRLLDPRRRKRGGLTLAFRNGRAGGGSGAKFHAQRLIMLVSRLPQLIYSTAPCDPRINTWIGGLRETKAKHCKEGKRKCSV